jgi:hypothetical protein
MTWCQFYLDRMGQKLYKYFSNDKLCFQFCKQYTEHILSFFWFLVVTVTVRTMFALRIITMKNLKIYFYSMNYEYAIKVRHRQCI